MLKHQRSFLSFILLLTIGHIIFCAFYQRIYGYFNLQNQLITFVSIVSIIRLLLLASIAGAGYLALRHSKTAVIFCSLLFLFNLVLPYLFN